MHNDPKIRDKFRLKRTRLIEIQNSIGMMEARIALESTPVVEILEKNIGYCKKQMDSIKQQMIKDGYKGQGLYE